MPLRCHYHCSFHQALSGFISTTLLIEISKSTVPVQRPQKRPDRELCISFPTWGVRRQTSLPVMGKSHTTYPKQVLHPQPLESDGNKYTTARYTRFSSKTLFEPACLPALAILQHVLALQGKHPTRYSVSVFAKRAQKGQQYL